jgi:hypothetical protein
MKIWMEASTCVSADVLIMDDRRFHDTFKHPGMLQLVRELFVQVFGIEPIKLVSADEYIFDNE